MAKKAAEKSSRKAAVGNAAREAGSDAEIGVTSRCSLATDEEYFRIIRDCLRISLNYKPAFGRAESGGVSLERFREIYGDDEFYCWFGLDTPLVYAAHRAAGGITSVYRQIGLGCQRLFQRILEDTLGLSSEEATWSYELKVRGKTRKLALDARIRLGSINSADAQRRCMEWLDDARRAVGLPAAKRRALDGCVFEIRQGYKSNDAKRQNADVANAANAYAHHYLPVMALLSTQIPGTLADRYARARWLLLRGTRAGTTTDSTYAFCRDVLGYDLAAFFERSAPLIRTEMEQVLEGLLR